MSSCRFGVLQLWSQCFLRRNPILCEKTLFSYYAHLSLKLRRCLWSRHCIQFSGYLLLFHLNQEVDSIEYNFHERIAYGCAVLCQLCLPAFNFKYPFFSTSDNQHIVYIYMCGWHGDSISVKIISATPLNHMQGNIFLYRVIQLLTLMFFWSNEWA